jgi:hypothetical protein
VPALFEPGPRSWRLAGILSLQFEGSGQIWYRNVYLRAIDKPLDFPR